MMGVRVFQAAGESHGGTDWISALTAGAAFITAIVAVAALIFEGRRTRLELGINNLWRLIEQWDQPEMRKRRADLAQTLKDDPQERSEVSDEGMDVLNTFELLAYLVVRSRTLKLEDAWINFSAWAISWWFVYKHAIDDMRRQDSTIFEDYSRLIDLFLDYESNVRDLDRNSVIPTPGDIEDFLDAEARLVGRLMEGDENG
jgi:hypothetical protein